VLTAVSVRVLATVNFGEFLFFFLGTSVNKRT
jgi:hypothetical protein